MAELVIVPQALLPDAWPRIGAQIESMCAGSGGKYRAVDLARAIAAGEFQLWGLIDGCEFQATMLSKVAAFPRARVCELLAVAGRDHQEWLKHLASVEAWAREQGCDRVQPIARAAWARVLKPLGYEHTHSMLEKRL